MICSTDQWRSSVTDRLLSIGEAAKRLRLSVQILRAYIDKGIIPAVKLPSGHRRIDPAIVERLRHEWGIVAASAPPDDREQPF
jgi:excisionase family DNA binding protein